MNVSEQKIALAASRSVDYIYNEAMALVKTQLGGPHLFISQALEKENVWFNIVCAPQYEVEIIRKGGDEFGRVRGEPEPIKIDFEKITEPYLIISTLYDEMLFDSVAEYQGKIILDVQGYVRARGAHGAKKMWSAPAALREKLWLVKTNELELKYLEEEFIAEQKNKILLVTHGSAGCELFVAGERYEIKPTQINAVHTVGAGDTLLGYFCAQLIKEIQPASALEFAVRKTEDFLYKNSSWV